MFVKLFSQILDSSIADNRQLRHFFTDLLLCADAKGYVVMTESAIARRIGATLEEVQWGLRELSSPDPRSKTPDNEGRRIEPLDGSGYGWKILNYEMYRAMRDAEQLREATRIRVQKHRAKKSCNAGNAVGNACNAMQKQIAEEEAEAIPELKNSGKEEGELFLSPKPVEKPKRGRPAKPADPRHQEAIKMFCDLYEERFGTKYAFPVSDAKQLSEFLKRCPTVGVSEMRDTLSDIWEYEVNKGEFVANRYRIHSLTALVLRWNDIKAILHTP